MSWILGIGIGAVVLVVAVWAWGRRERNGPPDHGTVSDQWRSEQRLKDRDSSDH